MADAKKILADIDTQWDAVKGKFIDAQSDYFKGGKYFQLLPTMTDAPKDGATKSPDMLTSKPYYQDKTTAQLATQYGLTVPNLAGLEIHQYVQPNGVRGWVAYLTAQVTDAKGNVQTWQRVENMAGEENYRSQDWTLVTPLDAKAELPVAKIVTAENAPEAKRGIDWQFVLTRAALGGAVVVGIANVVELFLK